MIKINNINELDRNYNSNEVVAINEKIINNIQSDVKKIISFNKKNPTIEIRINMDLNHNNFNKLNRIKNELLKEDISSDKIRIQLSGETIYNQFDNSFTTLEKYYSMKEINLSEKIINSMIDSIKVHNFSPLENIFACYMMVTLFKDYKEVNNNMLRPLSRSLNTILFNDYIVCEGYSNLFNKLLSGLNIKSSKLVYKTKANANHAVNIANIKDNKYRIYGNYLFDSTLDNKHKRDNEKEMNDSKELNMEGLSLVVNIPIDNFALSSDEFEIEHTRIKNLVFLNNGEEDNPLGKEKVSDDLIDTEVIRDCITYVCSKIYNTNLYNDESFEETLDYLLMNREENQLKM